MNSVSNVILFHSRDVNHSVSRSVSLLFILSSSSSCLYYFERENISAILAGHVQTDSEFLIFFYFRYSLHVSFIQVVSILQSLPLPSSLSFSILLRKHRHFKVKYCRNFFLRRKRGRDFRLKIAVNDYMIQFGKESKGKGIEERKGT